MPSVLVTAPAIASVDDPRLDPLRAAGWRINHHRWPGGRPSAEEVIELVQGNDAVIASSSEQYTREVFERADTLTHVARWGVGYETIDVPAATDNGVVITTTQGSNHTAVADHAFALMLAVARRLVQIDQSVRGGTWVRPLGADIWRQTIGIIGLGRIGKGMAQRASGFEMRVLAYEPVPDHEFCAKWNVELVPTLEDLFRQADFVTVHAPGDEVNRGLVNAERLALLKPSAIFINTARGVLVDEDALYAALTSGQLAGAGLDVRVSEPPTEQRFEALKNVVLTSHVAGSTYASQALTGVMVVDAVLKSASGEVPHGIVNADVWAQRRAV